jgi:hypothetical protein
MKIQFFDNYLIDVNFKSGYRIKFNKNIIDKYSLINFLANNFGEPITEENKIYNENYSLYIKRIEYVLVVETKEQLNQFTNFININTHIDYKSLSTKYHLFEKLKPFLFEPINIKNKNKIREIVRKILYIKPYDFILNLSKQGIYIKTKEDEYFIGCK